MPLPTLAVKGRLRAPNGDPKLQSEMDDWVPYQYIIDWFRTRQTKGGIINRVLVVKAETSSGKSTLLPAEIYRELVQSGTRGPGIICTQPRTLTAIRNVLQIISIPGTDYGSFLKLGDTIGWSTRFNKLRAKAYGLTSATVGTLTQHLSAYTDEELIKMYRYILIDETHERDLETDMTIYMLKNFLRRNQDNPNCPFVVLMSATFDPKKFIEYFDLDPVDNFIWCEGRSVGIDEHWDWNQGRAVNNYPQAAAMAVEHIIRNNPDDESELGDILIFMPGRGEIIQTAEWLSKLNDQLAVDNIGLMSIMKVDSESQKNDTIDYKLLDIPLQEHRVIVDGKVHRPQRRVIIATNFAETGITIPSLKYVIDSGYNKEIEFNPNYNLRALVARPAPKSRIIQRKGRAGRLFKGEFYPLYPEYIYKMLPDSQLPQILLEDVSPIMLDIINEQLKVKKLAGGDPVFSVNDIDMIDVPAPDALHIALEKLYILGFISPRAPKYEIEVNDILNNDELEDKFSLTRLGAIASTFSMTAPESIRMILSAYTWECSILDMITIAAYIGMSARGFIATAPKEEAPGVVGSGEIIGGSRSKPLTKTIDIERKGVLKKSSKKIKPGINWVEVYRMGAPGFLQSPNELYKLRVLLADEFIDGIFLFNAVKRIVAQSETKKALSDLQRWCTKVNVNYDSVIGFIKERDNIIEQMLTGEMDIFLNEPHSIANSTAETLMDTITKIKYCIYDGYRLNMIVREGVDYYTVNGRLQITPPELFKEDEQKKLEGTQYEFVATVAPKVLLFKEMGVKYNPITGAYDVIVDRVSVMDGFVNIDPSFAN